MEDINSILEELGYKSIDEYWKFKKIQERRRHRKMKIFRKLYNTTENNKTIKSLDEYLKFKKNQHEKIKSIPIYLDNDPQKIISYDDAMKIIGKNGEHLECSIGYEYNHESYFL